MNSLQVVMLVKGDMIMFLDYSFEMVKPTDLAYCEIVELDTVNVIFCLCTIMVGTSCHDVIMPTSWQLQTHQQGTTQ